MPAYNFQPEFMGYVWDGSKPHTVRLPRKNPTVPTDTLYHFTGMRTKRACKHITVTCLTVLPFNLLKPDTFLLGGVKLYGAAANALAWRDGFRKLPESLSAAEMMFKWFNRQYARPMKKPLETINFECVLWNPTEMQKHTPPPEITE